MSHTPVLKTSHAQRDLVSCYAYIYERNPYAAQRFRQAAEMTFTALAALPRSGTLYKTRHPHLKALRCVPVKHFPIYRIFYLPLDHGIHVIRVLHGARNIRDIVGYNE